MLEALLPGVQDGIQCLRAATHNFLLNVQISEECPSLPDLDAQKPTESQPASESCQK